MSTVLHQILPAKNGAIACITLNRTEVLNALSLGMIKEIRRLLTLWQSDSNIKMVIIRGNGKHFCAGGDVRQIHTLRQQNFAEAMEMMYQEYQLCYQIHCYPKPYLSLIHGVTMGGGVGLSLHGTHVVAADDLKLAMPEARIGFFPDSGVSYYLSRCPGKIGLYLALTGSALTQADAVYLKWVDACLPKQQFNHLIHTLQNKVLTGHSSQITEILKCLTYTTQTARPVLPKHIPLIDRYFSLPNIYNIRQALMLSPGRWAQETLALLEKCSPTSLGIAFRQWQLSKSCSIQACIQRDCSIAYYLLSYPDFYEGVRAVLIDKDFKPKWQAASLTDRVEQIVQGRFNSIKDSLEGKI